MRMISKPAEMVLSASSLVQYKHNLALSAMQNVSPRGPAVATRLAAIRRYREAWAFSTLQLTAGPLACFIAQHDAQLCRLQFIPFVGSLIGLLAGSELKLWCAPSPIRGLEAKTWSWGLRTLALEPQQGVVDLSRGVAVVCGIGTVDPRDPECHVLALCSSGNVTHHPMAARPVLSINAPQKHVYELALRGDMFSVTFDDAFTGTVTQLYNWREGMLMKEFTAPSTDWVHHSVLLDDRTLIISSSNHLRVHVLDYAGDHSSTVPPTVAPAYILRLPGDDYSCTTVMQMTCNESSAAADRAGLFQPDPDATLLSIRFGVTCNVFHTCHHGTRRWREYFLFIPRLTLLSRLKSTKPAPAGQSTELQWEEWSDEASVLLRVRHDAFTADTLLRTSFLGSRFALAIDSLQEDPPPYVRHIDVYIFDAHLNARPDGPECDRAREHASRYFNFGPTDDDSRAGGSCFPAARVSLPYRLLHKEFVSEERDQRVFFESTRVVMLDDGVALLRENNDPVAMQNIVTSCCMFSV
ncbi:hypothetical protein OH77DRAFT_951446 [Trametes cingulata]|nr:hypothetical protein OH77DRAFT_951446 [Trametes cingulata]